MKKVPFIVVALLLVSVMLVACSAASPVASTAAAASQASTAAAASQAIQPSAQSSNPSNTTIAQTGKGKTIGISHSWMGNDWNVYMKAAEVPYLESRGYTVNVTNAMGTSDQQKTDIQNFMSSKVDGIILAGGEAGAFVDLSSQIKTAGIPLVTVDMTLPGGISSVSCDNYGAGTQLGLWLVKQMKGEGKIIILDSPGWRSIQIRGDMVKYIFADYPNIKIVGSYEVNAQDPINSAYTITKSALQANPDLKGVLTTWGLPSLGANKAIGELNLNKQVVIANADSDKAILQAMAVPGAPAWAIEGQDSGTLGIHAASIMDEALTNGVNSVPFAEWGPTYLCTNVDVADSFAQINYVSGTKMWTIAYGDTDNPFSK